MAHGTWSRVRAALKMQLSVAEDNLARARRAFRGYSDEELAKTIWGESGRTCQQVLDGYVEEVELCRADLELIPQVES